MQTHPDAQGPDGASVERYLLQLLDEASAETDAMAHERDNAVNVLGPIYLDGIATERSIARADALEEAAKVCEELGANPISPWWRAATLECATAVRALTKGGT